MESLAVIFFPILLAIFAMAMDRFESRLNRPVGEDDADSFIDQVVH